MARGDRRMWILGWTLSERYFVELGFEFSHTPRLKDGKRYIINVDRYQEKTLAMLELLDI